ncbi:MAG: Ig-like domain repeat protein [Terracidiphilus sp.]
MGRRPNTIRDATISVRVWLTVLLPGLLRCFLCAAILAFFGSAAGAQSGVITTAVGPPLNDSSVSGASLIEPTGVAVDSEGNIYTADPYNCVVWKTHYGTTSVFAGILPSTQYSCTGPTPLAYPVAVAQCNGNVFVASNGIDPYVIGGGATDTGGTVDEVTSSGSLSALPLPGSGGAGAGPLHPAAVACDAKGNVYVSTYFYIADGGFASNVYQYSPVAGGGWTTGIPVEGLFDQAYPALAVNPVNGDLYGILAGQAGEGWLGPPLFSFGSIWDITQNATGVTSNNTFTNGSALAIDSNGNFYIAVGAQSYALASYVDFVQPNGTTTVIAGTGSLGYYGDGGLSTLAFVDGVAGIALDPTNDYIYLADSENQRVRRIHSLTAGPAALSLVNPSVPQSSSATYGSLQGALNPVTGDFYYVTGTNTVNVINTGASVISPGYERIIASMTVGAAGQAANGSTLTMVVDSTRNLTYVSNTTDGRLYVIDGSTHTVVGSVGLDNPNASLLAIDVALNEVYAGGPIATKVSAVRGGTAPYLLGNAGYPVNSLSVGANSDVLYGVADSGAGGASEEALITMTPDPTTGVLTASIAPFPLNEDVLQPAFIANSIAADPLSGSLIVSGAASIDTEFTQTYDAYDIFQFTPNFITAPVPYTWPPITTSLDVPNRVFYNTDFDGILSDPSSNATMVTGIDGVAPENNTLRSVTIPVFGSGATPASAHVYDAEPDTGSYQAWISGSDATDGGFVRLWDAGSQKVTLSATIPNNGGGHLFVNSSAQSAYLMDEVNGQLWLIDTPQWTPTPEPQFTQAPGGQTVTISAVNGGDAVYYTLDGSQPGLESTPCSSPCTVSLTVGEFTLINAIEVATVSGTQIASSVAQGVFTEPAPTSLVITLSPTPATTGATLTATATITPSNVIPSVTGTVSFAATPSGSFSPVTLCSSVNVAINMGNWQAVCNFVEDSAGSYTIAAAYSGDALNQPSTNTASLNVVQGIIPILGTISGDTNALAINQNNAPGLSYNAVLNTDSSVSLLQDGAILSGQGCPAYTVSGAGITVSSGAIFVDFANSNIYLAMLTGSGLYAAYESINQTTGVCTQGPLLQLSSISFGSLQMSVDPTAISSQQGNMYVMDYFGGGITDVLYIVPTAPWSALSLPTPANLTLDYSAQYGPIVIDPSNHQVYINDMGVPPGFFVYDPTHSATPANNLQKVVGYNSGGTSTALNVGTLLDNGAGKLVLVNENPSTSANLSVPITILDTTLFSFFTNTTNPYSYNNDVDITPGAGLSMIAATSQYKAIGGADINAASNVAYVFAFNSSSLTTPGLLLEYNLTPGAATPETVLSSSAAMPNLYDTSGTWSRLNYNPESTELALSVSGAFGSGALGLTSPLCAGAPISLTQVIGNIANPAPITYPVVNGTSGYVYAIQSGGIYFVAPPLGCGVTPPPIQISTAALPAGTVGTAYSQTITASGGTPPYTWSATGLPSGLTIGPSTGTISGTPTVDAGSPYSVTVTVTDTNSNTATKNYSLAINSASSGPIAINDLETVTVNDSPTPIQRINVSDSETITVNDSPEEIQSINVSDSEAITVTDAPVVSGAYIVGGSVSGLSSGVSLTLIDNGSDSLTIMANGAFSFKTTLDTGATYNVTIGSQPAGETCTITNGSGTVASANVTSVTVACKAATTTTLVISPSPASAGQPVTFSARVVGVNGGTPTGTVTFTCLNYAPGQSINSGPVALTNGVADWTTTSLPGDIYNSCFVATYSGDGNFLASTSAAESLTVIDFQIEFQAPSNLILWPGQSTTLTFTVAPANGAYNGTVNFAIAGLPADFPITFDPPAVTLGSSPQIVKVTISVPSLLVEQEKPMRDPGSAAPLALALVLPLLGLGPVRRRLRRGGWLVLTVLLSFIAMAGLSACVGGSGFFNQPLQTYTVTLTGISGTAQHSTKFNLTVE